MEHILSLGYATYEFSKRFPEIYKIAGDITSKPFYLLINEKVIEGASLNRNETEIYIETQRYQRLIFDPIKEAIDNKLIRDDLTPLFLSITITGLTGGLLVVLRNLKTFYSSLGINTDDIFELVMEWVAEGIKRKKQEEK